MTELYPIFLKLKNKLCVVVGGGKVAERKILSLLPTEAQIKVISPELTEKLEPLSREEKFIWIKRPYQRGDLQGAFLVIAATNDPQVQEAVFKEAEERGLPCNVVDKPEFCTFFVPSTLKRGNLLIAISTSGASPAVARRLRETLESLFPQEFALYLELMKAIRMEILKKELDPIEKEGRLQRLALAPLFQYLVRGDFELLEAILEKEGLPNLLSEISSLYRASKDIERQG